jgi:hypothetical protein
MLARLILALPFNIAVPEGAMFDTYAYEDDGYEVRVFPPGRTDRPLFGDVPDGIMINDARAFVANGLRVDFRRESFDRTRDHSVDRAGLPTWDPPEAVVTRAIDSFLKRLRYVTRGAQIHRVGLQDVSWRLHYLNDDGSELPIDSALHRALGSVAFRWSLIGLNPDVWEQIHSLPPDFEPPVWDTLRLDADAALPNIGTAVVLAAACLEVFISSVLDQLAAGSTVPPALWAWVNKRGGKRRDPLKEPSTEEQFDSLLHLFTGHSLKEEGRLWEAFMNLKTARNAFVHEGIAQVGRTPLSVEDAAGLVARIRDIINWVKQWLPIDFRWPEFESSIRLTLEANFRASGDTTVSQRDAQRPSDSDQQTLGEV